MISRRDMLKYGMGAAALSGVSLGQADADDGGGVGKTPFKTEPFVEPLPIPAIKTPVSKLSPGTLASPGFTNERIAIFRAEAEPNKPPEEEGVSVEKIPLSRLAALLFDGADLDSKTVVGLFLATDASRNRR